MKNLIFLLFLLSLFINLNSISGQGNLQFNRVVIESTGFVTLDNANPSFSTNINIPAGKVWKIEYATVAIFQNGKYFTLEGDNWVRFSIDGFLLWRPNNNTVQNLIQFPFWLPQGTYNLSLEKMAGYSSTLNNCIGKISIIEFNIVP
jgi:hypothetical protein